MKTPQISKSSRHSKITGNYAEQTVCIMRMYSNEFGPWNSQFRNRSLVSLQDAALERGFVLPRERFFHDSRIDAQATAFLWRYLDQHFLPKPPIDVTPQANKLSPWEEA